MNEALLPSSISLVWTFHLFRVDSNIFSSLAHIQIVSREKCQNSYFPLYDPKIQTKLSNPRFWNFTWTEEGFSAFLTLFSNLLIGNETRFWDSLVKHSYWRCDLKCFSVIDREVFPRRSAVIYKRTHKFRETSKSWVNSFKDKMDRNSFLVNERDFNWFRVSLKWIHPQLWITESVSHLPSVC